MRFNLTQNSMNVFLTENQILHGDGTIIVDVLGQMLTSKTPVGYLQNNIMEYSDIALTSASFTMITAFQVTASYQHVQSEDHCNRQAILTDTRWARSDA
jgi:hypothetical protein